VGYRIEIAVDDCMSSGKCVGDYPNTFDFGDEELAVLVEGGAVLSADDMIRVARNCPSRALLVFDQDNNPVPT
jgi:ferredoxin